MSSEVHLYKQANLATTAILSLAALFQIAFSSSLQAADGSTAQSLVGCRLQAASYFGGSGNEQGWPSTRTVIDADGSILFAIVTASAGLIGSTAGYDTSYNGGGDALIVRMNADLTQVLSATYLGGSGSEVPDALSLDDQGRVYVSGSTTSGNFPATPGAYDVTHGSVEDAFVAILSPDLDSLLAATYIGGNGSDQECASIVASDGSVFAALSTASTDLPVSPGAIQSSHGGGGGDFYLMRLNGNLTAASASTYFGGNGIEFRPRLAIDGNDDIYVTGSTFSSNIPVTSGAYDTQNSDGSIDAFISHISKTLDVVLASTYVGGGGTDWSYAILLDRNSDVYITGHAHSHWPTTHGCYDSTYGGGTEEGSDAYLCRLSGDLSTVKASTYLGGSGWDWGVDLARDSHGEIYVVGETSSPNFPLTKGACGSTCCYTREMFVARFDSTMQTLHMSTLIGGTGDDRWPGVAIATSDCVFAVGYTTSAGLQTTAGAYDNSYAGSGDMYVAKFSFDPFVCGDANGDASLNISDAVSLIAYIFAGGAEPDPKAAGDANCDNAVNISDAVYLIAYIFAGGSEPCAGCA